MKFNWKCKDENERVKCEMKFSKQNETWKFKDHSDLQNKKSLNFELVQ